MIKNKYIFIINGSGGVGKDTFVELVSEYVNTMNYSSVDKVKHIAKMCGWNGKKSEKDRKFLSDLKLLTSEYCNMPFEDMVEKINEFNSSDCRFLFLHIREPEEIEKMKLFAQKNNFVKTILITRDSVKKITTNMADKNVSNYNYDITINNDGSIDDLKEQAISFAFDILIIGSMK